MNTDQERAWAGEFGLNYSRRSPGDEEANYQFFKAVLRTGQAYAINPTSFLEVGAGMGANVRALNRLYPSAAISALELNAWAAEQMQLASDNVRVIQESLLDWDPCGETWDLVLTKGLLIHINPDRLAKAYETIYKASNRWILLCEYYNPTPVEVPYRGEQGMLWKRDFAGDMLDQYPSLALSAYGFRYHRDDFPQDDLNWWLLQKHRQIAESKTVLNPAAAWPFPERKKS